MGLLWLWDIAVVAVVTPVVVVLLRRVVVSASTVRKTVEEIAAVGGAMVVHLEAVRTLAETQRLIGEATTGLARYGRALDEIL